MASLRARRSSFCASLAYVEQAYPQHRLTLISRLGEGAERSFVSHAVRNFGVGVEAVLDSSVRENRGGFETEEAGAELSWLCGCANEVKVLPDGSGGDGAADAVGEYILKRADVLVLFGGPEPSGEIECLMSEARARDKPLIRIQTGVAQADGAGESPEGAGPGRIILENF